MKIYNPIGSGKASGKAFGGVFSYNRGLPTFKKYVLPVQRNTTETRNIKNRFSFITKYWKTQLTLEQITAWNEWPLPWTDIYGHEVTLTGINKFFICNETLHRAGKAISVDPPTLTPSELTFSSFQESETLYAAIKGISNSEISNQESFVKIECALETFLAANEDPEFYLNGHGLPISRKILEKNYTLAGFISCHPNTEGITDWDIFVTTDETSHKVGAVRFTRFNKWGFWSSSVVLTGEFWTA